MLSSSMSPTSASHPSLLYTPAYRQHFSAAALFLPFLFPPFLWQLCHSRREHFCGRAFELEEAGLIGPRRTPGVCPPDRTRRREKRTKTTPLSTFGRQTQRAYLGRPGHIAEEREEGGREGREGVQKEHTLKTARLKRPRRAGLGGSGLKSDAATAAFSRVAKERKERRKREEDFLQWRPGVLVLGVAGGAGLVWPGSRFLEKATPFSGIRYWGDREALSEVQWETKNEYPVPFS